MDGYGEFFRSLLFIVCPAALIVGLVGRRRPLVAFALALAGIAVGVAGYLLWLSAPGIVVSGKVGLMTALFTVPFVAPAVFVGAGAAAVFRRMT